MDIAQLNSEMSEKISIISYMQVSQSQYVNNLQQATLTYEYDVPEGTKRIISIYCGGDYGIPMNPPSQEDLMSGTYTIRATNLSGEPHTVRCVYVLYFLG